MRRTKEEAEQTRWAILETAMREFVKTGFDESTIDSIAKASGYTRGAVYWHFKDKNDLFESLIEYKDFESIEIFKRIVDSEQDIIKKIKKVIGLNFPEMKSARETKNFILMKAELYLYRTRYGDKQEIGKMVREFLEKSLEEAKNKNLLKKGVDAEQAASTIISLVTGTFVGTSARSEDLINLKPLEKIVMDYIDGILIK